MIFANARRLVVALPLALAGACAGPAADSEYASEELALTDAEGRAFCSEAGKILVCHVPPGNPANAHEICVGEAAREAHERHGDRLGACGAEAAGNEAATPVSPR